MPYDPRAIANYFLELAKNSGETLSPMKVQKLVYFANAWNLAIKGEPLVDRPVEAWTFGPVIPVIYNAFREFGDRPITKPASDYRPVIDPETGSQSFKWVVPGIDGDSEGGAFVRSLLKRVWDVYGPFSAIQLSNMTHKPGSPWHRVYERHDGKIPQGAVVPTDMIRDYFVGLARSKAVRV